MAQLAPSLCGPLGGRRNESESHAEWIRLQHPVWAGGFLPNK